MVLTIPVRITKVLPQPVRISTSASQTMEGVEIPRIIFARIVTVPLRHAQLSMFATRITEGESTYATTTSARSPALATPDIR